MTNYSRTRKHRGKHNLLSPANLKDIAEAIGVCTLTLRIYIRQNKITYSWLKSLSSKQYVDWVNKLRLIRPLNTDVYNDKYPRYTKVKSAGLNLDNGPF